MRQTNLQSGGWIDNSDQGERWLNVWEMGSTRVESLRRRYRWQPEIQLHHLALASRALNAEQVDTSKPKGFISMVINGEQCAVPYFAVKC